MIELDQLYWFGAATLVVALLASLIRVVLGPTQPDRMLATQLFGTIGIAAILLLAFAIHDPAIIDVALVLAALALVTIVSFVRRVRPPLEGE
jgi:multicomponent Na+:H+ antiporter subunit F